MTAPPTMPSDALPDEVERAIDGLRVTAIRFGECRPHEAGALGRATEQAVDALRAAIAAYASARSAPARDARIAEEVARLREGLGRITGMKTVSEARGVAAALLLSAPAVQGSHTRPECTCPNEPHDVCCAACREEVQATPAPASARSGEAAPVPAAEVEALREALQAVLANAEAPHHPSCPAQPKVCTCAVTAARALLRPAPGSDHE